MQTDSRDDLIQVLNDLVRIHNDRIRGYERAVQETRDGDSDLVSVFNRMIEESRQFKGELADAIQLAGGRADYEETTNSGKLYRFWMKIKESVKGKDRGNVLDDCEFGEDAAQKAYQEALESDATMAADTRKLIMNQKTSLKDSHDTIKRLRDMQNEMSEAKDGNSLRSYNH